MEGYNSQLSANNQLGSIHRIFFRLKDAETMQMESSDAKNREED